MKKIINIEGIDGTGKQTQANVLKQRLHEKGYDVNLVSFPNYNSNTFAIKGIQQVLSGEINNIRKDFADNSYAVSLLYALDRYLSIENIVEESKNKILILDRYVESNISYQSVGDNTKDMLQKAKWLYDLEYNKLNLPKPDLTILLDIPLETSIKLREGREYKSGTNKDIYEENNDFLNTVRKNSLILAKEFKWKILSVVDENNDILPIEEISNLIWKEVVNIL